MERSETIVELTKSLIKVQAEMPTVKKGETNPFFKSKYADLKSVLVALLPLLTKNGLAISQQVSNIDGQTALTTTLLHESGEFISATRPLLMPKEDPQGQGSAITYARRYDAMSIIGMIADNDDDGNQATTSFGEEQDLQKAKDTIFEKMKSKGITNFADQLAFVRDVTGKTKIYTIEEADLIMARLDEE